MRKDRVAGHNELRYVDWRLKATDEGLKIAHTLHLSKFFVSRFDGVFNDLNFLPLRLRLLFLRSGTLSSIVKTL